MRYLYYFSVDCLLVSTNIYFPVFLRFLVVCGDCLVFLIFCSCSGTNLFILCSISNKFKRLSSFFLIMKFEVMVLYSATYYLGIFIIFFKESFIKHKIQ